MIESIEGKRGIPRLRPPYVAQVGLFGYPTLEHNMETVFWVREIVEKGPEWFVSHGRHGRKGLRSFSVSGRVRKPGVHLAPAQVEADAVVGDHAGVALGDTSQLEDALALEHHFLERRGEVENLVDREPAVVGAEVPHRAIGLDLGVGREGHAAQLGRPGLHAARGERVGVEFVGAATLPQRVELVLQAQHAGVGDVEVVRPAHRAPRGDGGGGRSHGSNGPRTGREPWRLVVAKKTLARP